MEIDTEKILKDLLQKHIRLYIKNKVYKEGKLVLFKHECYSFELILVLSNNKKKKIDIPVPFTIEEHAEDNLIYFDYRLNSFVRNDIMLTKLKEVSKNSKSKFYDTVLEIEVIKNAENEVFRPGTNT